MRNRTAIVAAGVVLALLVTGLAWAAADSTTARSETNVAIAAGQEQIIPVDTAGSVVLLRTDTQLQILSVIPNTGYTPEIEVAAGREVEADFRGEGRRVKFNAELEDGQVRVRIEVDNDDTANNIGSTSSTSSTSSASSTSSTSSTLGNSSTSSTSSPSTTAGTANIPNGNVTYPMGAGGTVTVSFNSGNMSIVSINAAAGWTVIEVQDDSDEIEVELRNGDSAVEFKLDIEGGRVRVELKNDDNDNNSGSGSGGDDDDDDDNSGSDSGGGGNSGSGG